MSEFSPLNAFLEAATVSLDGGHRSGTLARALEILSEYPSIAANIYAAAVLGDDTAVARALKSDRRLARAKGGVRGWDALTYLCFSRFLRLDRSRTRGFVAAATALLDAGANANTGFDESSHRPKPQFESVIYGAAGVAQHPELTRLLLEHGADPNDGETPYHVPENFDNTVLQILVNSGAMSADSMATLLLRKHDWHDRDAIVWLLEHGADPNRMTPWGKTAMHQALLRDNSLSIIEALLDQGGDAAKPAHGASAAAIAARRGRADVLKALARRGPAPDLADRDRLLAACALDDEHAIEAMAQSAPDILETLTRDAGQVLAEFAGNGNTAGVRRLLDLGVNVAALFSEGDGYWRVAKHSTALHVAAWRAQHDTVKFLIARGAPIDARDADGRTPLMLAIRACVDSYWTGRRSPESIEALLAAGASIADVKLPTGYAEADAAIRRRA